MLSAAEMSRQLHSTDSGVCGLIQSDLFTTPLFAEIFNNPTDFIKFIKSCHGSRDAQDEIIRASESKLFSYV